MAEATAGNDQPEIHHDPDSGRFYLETEGGEARLSYREQGDVLDFVSTYTSPELRGKGLAAKVVQAGMEYARQEGKQVRPSCPYVPVFLRRYPQYQDLAVGN